MASVTELCNMALARLGAKRLTNYETDTTLEAIHCRAHYEQTRDALLRSHRWRFAMARATLSEDAAAPAFEWDHQFVLPTDFLRMSYLYDSTASYDVEGQRLLTNDDAAEIVYVKRVTDPTEFDPLFIEVLVLKLAIKLVMPLTQDKVLRRELQDELKTVAGTARLANLDETNTTGRDDFGLWNDARSAGGIFLQNDTM